MQRQRSFGSGRPRSPCRDCISGPQKLSTSALAYNPADHANSIFSMNNMGISHMESSNFDEAIALFRRALDEAENGPANLRLLGGNVGGYSTGSTAVIVATSTGLDMKASPLKEDSFANLDKGTSNTSKTPNSFLVAHSHIAEAQRVPQDCRPMLPQIQEHHREEEGSEKSESKEYYIYPRREYDEGVHMYYSPIRMDAFSIDSTSGPHSIASSVLCYNLGQAYVALEQDDEARQWFERALHSSNGYLNMSVQATVLSPLKILHNLGYLQYRRQDIHGALQTFREALQDSQRSVSKLDVANSLNALGVLYFHLPEPDALQSMECFMQALTIRRAVLGPTHVDVATCLNNIGRVHYIDQRYDEALLVYQEALRIRRHLLGKDHLDVAATVYNAGQSYHHLGKLDLALLFYEEFVRITVPKLGSTHRDVAIIFKCMAQIHHERDQFDQALALYKKALVAAQNSLGVHAETASIFNKLGNLYYENEDFDNATDMYEQGLELERAALHRLHPNIIVTLSNLGQIWKQRGEYDSALRVYSEALDMQIKSLGNSHPAIAVTLSNIGLINYQTRNYTKALDLYQEALRIRREAFGENNLEVASALNSIGLVLFKLGLHDLAMQTFLESLRLRRDLLGSTHRDVAIILYNIATIHMETGADNEAMRCYRETLRIERLALGEDHEDVLLTITYIAQVNQNKGDLQAALDCYDEILKSQKRSRPDDHESIARTLNRMANIHLQSGHPKMVVDLMTEASRRMRLVGRSEADLNLNGFHLYGFSRVHPEASSAA